MRETELSSVLVIQTASFPAAAPLGARPTGACAAIAPDFGSITPTEFGATDDACALSEPACVKTTTAAIAAAATATAAATARRSNRVRPTPALFSGGNFEGKPSAVSW